LQGVMVVGHSAEPTQYRTRVGSQCHRRCFSQRVSFFAGKVWPELSEMFSPFEQVSAFEVGRDAMCLPLPDRVGLLIDAEPNHGMNGLVSVCRNETVLLEHSDARVAVF